MSNTNQTQQNSPKSSSADKEDFLEVDTPIPGQSYVCLSFVSPDKVLNTKEKYMFYNYILCLFLFEIILYY